jgi:hypothetical protein
VNRRISCVRTVCHGAMGRIDDPAFREIAETVPMTARRIPAGAK